MSRNSGTDTRNDRRRIALFGMQCAFTAPIVEALAQSPHLDLQLIVLPAKDPRSQTDSHPVMEIARTHGLPTTELMSRSQLTSSPFRETLEELEPDLIVVACFPWRLPGWILELPTIGAINIHPSLLPDGRGPEPIFWAFRWGLETTGVTLHLMDEGLDTGPVITQEKLAIPDDATIPTLEQSLAGLGARMLVGLLSQSPLPLHTTWPQDKSRSRYAPFPQADDLVVTTRWKADHAARFINAVAPVYGAIPVLVLSTGQRLAIDRVIAVDDGSATDEPAILSGDAATIRFADGALQCRLQTTSQPLLLRSGLQGSQ